MSQVQGVHSYPPHKRHPGRDTRRMKDRTKVVALRIFESQEEFEMMRPYLDMRKPYAIKS